MEAQSVKGETFKTWNFVLIEMGALSCLFELRWLVLFENGKTAAGDIKLSISELCLNLDGLSCLKMQNQQEISNFQYLNFV